MQQQQMFQYDQEVLKQELNNLIEKNKKGELKQETNFKQLDGQLTNMIAKLDQIQGLNNQAKKNDVFKEKLH